MPLPWMSRVINARHVWIRRVVDYGNGGSDGNSFIGVANGALGIVCFAADHERVIDVIVVLGGQFGGDRALRQCRTPRQTVEPWEMN